MIELTSLYCDWSCSAFNYSWAFPFPPAVSIACFPQVFHSSVSIIIACFMFSQSHSSSTHWLLHCLYFFFWDGRRTNYIMCGVLIHHQKLQKTKNIFLLFFFLLHLISWPAGNYCWCIIHQLSYLLWQLQQIELPGFQGADKLEEALQVARRGSGCKETVSWKWLFVNLKLKSTGPLKFSNHYDCIMFSLLKMGLRPFKNWTPSDPDETNPGCMKTLSSCDLPVTWMLPMLSQEVVKDQECISYEFRFIIISPPSPPPWLALYMSI